MGVLLNNPYLLAIGILSVLDLIFVVLLAWRFWVYRKTQKVLLAGEDAGMKLEDLIVKQKKQISLLTKNLKDLGKLLEEIVENNKINIQKVGVVRFNPFANTGGNMSFVVALLDGHDNGILISSLHSREGTRIYAKSVEKGTSEYNLTEEEREALEKAQGPFDKLRE